MNRFAVFILTHGRAKTITTYDFFRKNGYTGDMWVVIDNEDDQENLYRERFGDAVIQFDKRDYVKKTDLGDLDDDRRIGVLARNFIQDKAKEMGYKFHMQLDDDIYGINIRYERNGKLYGHTCHHIDEILSAMVDFMESAPITSLSLGLAPYYAGGLNSGLFPKGLVPKTMTTFLMRADDVQYFNMRMNDDITTSALNGSRGKLYFSVMPLLCDVQNTQVQSGGMTEIYQDNGTYRKSFYSVMAIPSACKIYEIRNKDTRIHHQIQWEHLIPKILSDKYQRFD